MGYQNEKNIVDDSFDTIKEFVACNSEAQIIKFICENFAQWAQETPRDILIPVLNFHKRFRFWGNFDLDTDDITMVSNRARMLKERWTDIEELYHTLSDFRSKHILVMILENWLSFSFDKISKVKEAVYEQYFDMDLFPCDEKEIFVDLGAYEGDTAESYRSTYGLKAYNKIYCYEIVEDNIRKIKEKFAKDSRIIVRPVGVSNKTGVMYLSDNGTVNAQSLKEQGKNKVNTVTLDQDIKDKITFLKMDIEGEEKNAIEGARNHIQRDCPKMAISIYHSNEDLVDIYLKIKEIQPAYDFYLRYYGSDYCPTDYILMCVPKRM